MKIERQTLFQKFVETSDFSVLSDGFVETDDSWRQPPLYAQYSRIYYVMDGSGVLYSDTEETLVLEPGYAYLAPCGVKCGFYGTPSVIKLYFHVNMTLFQGGYDVFAGCTHFLRFPITRERMKEMKTWYLSSDPYDHAMLKHRLYADACKFLQMIRDSGAVGERYSKTVALAMTYIRKNLNASLKVSEVANAIFCSQSKLSLLFREEVGQSVALYIDDLLMSEAKSLLMYSDRSIGVISELLGFCDQFYFSRWFSKRFSISPSHFRKVKNEE